MFFKSVFSAGRPVIWLVSALVLFGATRAGSQPSQSPLLSRDGGGVAPNLILDIDDSGSMGYQHVPEGSFTLATKPVTIAGNNSLIMHPLDTRSSTNFLGVWTADIGSTHVYQRQVRSADVNSIYYNPETTYLPWIKKNTALAVPDYDGSRFPNANVNAASFNPLVTATATTVAGSVPPITYVGSGSSSTAALGNVTPGLPAGRAANDLLICLAESYDLVSHVPPAGWILIYNLKGTLAAPHSASAFYKIAGAADANPVLGHTAGSSIVAGCFAYRGVDLAQPFDLAYAPSAGAISTDTTDTSIGTGSLASTTKADAMILIASHQAHRFSSLSVGTGGGFSWTEANVFSFNGAGVADVGVAMHYATKAAIGTTAARVVTSDRAGSNTGVLLALRTGPAGPATTTVTNGVDLGAATSAVSAKWCTTTSTDCGTSVKSFTPMLFYRLKKDGSGNYLAPDNSANYDTYDLTNNQFNGGPTTVAPQTYPKRTDCTAGVCSITQERQNYANWFVYHRSRLLVAQAAIAESFWNIGETKLRVGWGQINNLTNATIDGEANTQVIVEGVRNFSVARKDALFSYIRNITPNSGTPLQQAMWAVGTYYEKASPWLDDPGNAAFADPVGSGPKDCRRAYHLLITDGLWSTAPTNLVGNADSGNPVTGTDYANIKSASGEDIVVAKGKPYSDGNANYLSDYASWFFNRDLRPTLANNVQPSPPGKLAWQAMINFTVGLGLTGTLDPTKDLPALTAGTLSWGSNKVDDLWHAAVNSEGRYFSAKNSSELATSLTSALTTTQQNELEEAGVATSSNVLEDGNRKYIPVYKSGAWTGDIRALELDSKGLTVKGPLPGDEIWLASVANSKAAVPWATRKLFTWDAVAKAPAVFTWSGMGADNQAAIGPGTGSAQLIDFIRGDETNEKTVASPLLPYRPRTTRFGDFINSNPVLIKKGSDLGYSTLSAGGADYAAYRTGVKAARHGVLFVGSNDGMVHAFKDQLGKFNVTDTVVTPAVAATDGREIFAYVPRAVYPNLTKLSDQTYGTTALYHQFYVDGALSETDAYVKATALAAGPTWRNYLTGSLGAGGRAVFALDVTDMTTPGVNNIKWEFSNIDDGDLGNVSAPIEVGVLPDNTWVAIFGNGPFSDAGKAVLFVLNLETGAMNKVTVDALIPSNGLGGVGVQRDSSGYITNLFVGDLNGSLWKLDYDTATPSKFKVSGSGPFFKATSSAAVPQPITQAPLVYDFTNGGAAAGKLIVFGTGKLLTELDRDTVDTQSMYGVWDKVGDTVARPLVRSQLVSRELESIAGGGGSTFYGLKAGTVINYSGTTERGWVVDLSLGSPDIFKGERIIYPPQRISSKLALFSAVAPAKKAEVCSSAIGTGANFIIPIETGQNPTYKMFDVNGDGKIDGTDPYVLGYATKSDGIDSIVKSGKGSLTATDEICPAGFERTSIQNTTGQVMACIEIEDKTPSSVLRDRIWRRIINPPIR